MTRSNARDSVNSAVFDDLGSGQTYGSFQVLAGAQIEDVLSFTLNGAALAAIQASQGGFFSIGGAVQNLTPDTDTLLFAFGGGEGIQRLIIEIAEPVPEIMNSGFALLAALLAVSGCKFVTRKDSAKR